MLVLTQSLRGELSERGYLGRLTGSSDDSFEVLRSTRCPWSRSWRSSRQESPSSFGIGDGR